MRRALVAVNAAALGTFNNVRPLLYPPPSPSHLTRYAAMGLVHVRTHHRPRTSPRSPTRRH